MIFAGVDVGAQSVKVVILDDSQILFAKTTVTEEEGGVASNQAMEEALKHLNMSFKDLSYVVSTGVGRSTVGFANKQRSEQLCHARGGVWLFPSARTVLDAGAGGGRAMRLNEEGRVVDFATNTKCAAGTGAFLEAITRLLEIHLLRVVYEVVMAKFVVRTTPEHDTSIVVRYVITRNAVIVRKMEEVNTSTVVCYSVSRNDVF